MIPTPCAVAAGILQRCRPAAAFVLLVLSGCAADRETTLSRTARGREVGAARAERQQQQRELASLRQTHGATVAAIADATTESVRRSAELRAVLAELHHQISLQQTAEQDLVAAKARAVAIEQELQPLRLLEQTLRDQERLREEAHARVAALQAELEAATGAALQKQNEVQPQLVALQQQVEAARQIEQAIAAAQASISEARKLLAPPVPPAPAVPPAAVPAVPKKQ